MARWRTHTRLPILLDALCGGVDDPEVRQVAGMLGGEQAEDSVVLVGEPPRRSRRLVFASGAEILLHDDAVVAIVLPLDPGAQRRDAITLSDWIPGTDNGATLAELIEAIGVQRRFAGFGTPYFDLDGAFVRAEFRDRRGWNEPGNLRGITVTTEEPGVALRPEDDRCPRCSELLMRSDDGAVDVERTTETLLAAVAAGDLTEDQYWVRLTDLRALHSSGLMDRAESHLTCAECRRIICFTLYRERPATFGYHGLQSAQRRSMGAIPPVEQWGDAARIAEEEAAMRYVDHEPGAWFLVEQQGTLYLDARYAINTMIDSTALIQLNESEVAGYRERGHDYLSRLAMRINADGPYHDASPFYGRNLYGSDGGEQLRKAVSAAIVNHTWLAQQRRT